MTNVNLALVSGGKSTTHVIDSKKVHYHLKSYVTILRNRPSVWEEGMFDVAIVDADALWTHYTATDVTQHV